MLTQSWLHFYLVDIHVHCIKGYMLGLDERFFSITLNKRAENCAIFCEDTHLCPCPQRFQSVGVREMGKAQRRRDSVKVRKEKDYVLTGSWIYELYLVGIDRVKNREGEPVKTGVRDRMNEEGIDFDGATWKE